MALRKYRIHEVAKDFHLTPKAIADILSQFDIPVKNHMQVLTQLELNIIFEYLSQHSVKYASSQEVIRKNTINLSSFANKSNFPIAIIEWDENDFYVSRIDPSKINREYLVEICANHAVYFDDYQEAIDSVSNLVKSYQEIKISDYPIPDLGSL